MATEIKIDTSDGPEVLTAARNMLNELLSESAGPVVAQGNAPVGGEEVAQQEVVAEEPAVDAVEEGAASSDGGRIDPNGVPFDGMFCGQAAKPFYASGKRSGQWKKRQGVDDGDYDRWYAAELAKVAPPESEEPTVDTAGAFAGAAQGAAEPPAPTDCGAFMGWAAAKQAAGKLTQDDIGAAYMQAEVQVADLFPPNDEVTVAARVAKLHQLLVAKAGA